MTIREGRKDIYYMKEKNTEISYIISFLFCYCMPKFQTKLFFTLSDSAQFNKVMI